MTTLEPFRNFLSDARARAASKPKLGQSGSCQFQRMMDRTPFYQSQYRPIMIDKAIANQSSKPDCRFAGSICGDGCIPDGLPSASMTMPFDCHFAQRNAGRATLGRPLMQALVPPYGGLFRACCLGWCGRWESNPHSLRNGILNPARLPIPPRPRCEMPIAPRSKHATANISYLAYAVALAAFFRAATFGGLALPWRARGFPPWLKCGAVFRQSNKHIASADCWSACRAEPRCPA